jgi:pantoate--beta-alanine ligase
VQPDVAVFGEKDYQQLMVVMQMVRDLDLPLQIVGAPTVREADGLAMSSRNAYLSADERRIATMLNRVIMEVATKVASGGDIGEATGTAKAALTQAGFGKIDYVEVRDAATLRPAKPDAGRPLRVLAAVWLGKTRLIDNVGV